jgi:hypothetical protein
MPSKLRIVVKEYNPKKLGYGVYKGGDAVRFLEQHSRMKLIRPFVIPNLNLAFKHAFSYIAETTNNVIELHVWRVKGPAKRNSLYSKALNLANSLKRWPSKGVEEDPRLPVGLRKDEPKKKIQFFKYNVDFVVGRAGQQRAVNPINYIDEAGEPRDR